MRVDCGIITCLHLDPGYALLSVQNTLTCMEMFSTLDVHRTNRINDVQFMLLLRNFTNLSRYELEVIFNLLDVDHSGEIDFEEFYLVFCIVIANKDCYEKEFIYRHSGTIFQLIDADGSGQISAAEFSYMGVLFNFDHSAINRIFKEFDISGDKSLDFGEFRLFTMACIDEARAQETRDKVKAFAKYRARLLNALQPTLRRYVRTERLPRPKEMEEVIVHVRRPYIPGKRDISGPFKYSVIIQAFKETREEIRDYFKEKLQLLPCLFCFIGYVLCCYCCMEDPWVTTGRKCHCKCNCRCFPCWYTYIRKIWTCCYCLFPCCHCCQAASEYQQHIARKRKMKWPIISESEESEIEALSLTGSHMKKHSISIGGPQGSKASVSSRRRTHPFHAQHKRVSQAPSHHAMENVISVLKNEAQLAHNTTDKALTALKSEAEELWDAGRKTFHGMSKAPPTIPPKT